MVKLWYHAGVIKWKLFPLYWHFVRWIHRSIMSLCFKQNNKNLSSVLQQAQKYFGLQVTFLRTEITKPASWLGHG